MRVRSRIRRWPSESAEVAAFRELPRSSARASARAEGLRVAEAFDRRVRSFAGIRRATLHDYRTATKLGYGTAGSHAGYATAGSHALTRTGTPVSTPFPTIPSTMLSSVRSFIEAPACAAAL